MAVLDCCIVCLEDVVPSMTVVNCFQCTGLWCVECHAKLIQEKCPQCRVSLSKRPKLAVRSIFPAKKEVFVLNDYFLHQVLNKLFHGQKGAGIDLLLRRRIVHDHASLTDDVIIKVWACYTGVDNQKHRCTIFNHSYQSIRCISVAVSEQTFQMCVERKYINSTSTQAVLVPGGVSKQDLPHTTGLLPGHTLMSAYIPPLPLFPRFGKLRLEWKSTAPGWPNVHLKLHCRTRSCKQKFRGRFEKKASA